MDSGKIGRRRRITAPLNTEFKNPYIIKHFMDSPAASSFSKYYFVDEAGDTTLFKPRLKPPRVMIGEPGCSRYFILGKLDVAAPKALAGDLSALRKAFLEDPTLNRQPSMLPKVGKTAVAFHAKDDLPEVRREVFRVLVRHQVGFYAVVRDKTVLARQVLTRNESDPAYRYNTNEVYDRMVAMLFRDRIHKDAGYEIVFAKRGKRDRTHALNDALDRARRNLYIKWKIKAEAPIRITATTPAHAAGLQAADHFLWALQRLFERAEDRYWSVVWPAVHLVRDLDDTRQAGYGVYYTQKKPLTLDALTGRKK